MPSPYRIKTVVAGDGERIPMLLNDSTGLPLFDPTAFILTEVRMKNRAVNTIKAQLTSIEAMLIHFQSVGIDISERIRSGKFLEIWEIDGLNRAIRLTIPELVRQLDEAKTPEAPTKVPSRSGLESFRQRLPMAQEETVDQTTAGNRMRVVRNYLTWLVNRQLGRLAPASERFQRLMTMRDLVLDAIEARIPSGKGTPSQREGLDPATRPVLLDVIDPANSQNPWQHSRVRQRNHLIILLLYHLGLRRGELLSIKLEDVDLRNNTITIHRRPDDPEDPRHEQPTAKTLGRIIPINDGLAQLIIAYFAMRREVPGADRHPFLFVETDRGRPLSISGLTKVFDDLNACHRQTLGKITAHVLRHDWNDRFSELMDRRRTSGPEEEKQRSHLMGWREGSGTAATYTRRHTRKRAQESSIKMQNEAFGNGGGNAGSK